MLNKIFDIIEKYESLGNFTYGYVLDSGLNEVESRLNIKLPQEYREFLIRFGHGGIGGLEILGVGREGEMIFEEETVEFRKYGLPHHLIVIENCDEWVYCINSNNGKIVTWSMEDDEIYEDYDSFGEYLYDRVTDILENS